MDSPSPPDADSGTDTHRLTPAELAGEVEKWDQYLWQIAAAWWEKAGRVGEIDDYHSEAVLGFLRANHRYDRRQTKYVTFAGDWSHSFCRRHAAKELARGFHGVGSRDELKKAPTVPIVAEERNGAREWTGGSAGGMSESWLDATGRDHSRRGYARDGRAEELVGLAADLAAAAAECLTEEEVRVVTLRHRDGLTLREVGLAIAQSHERARTILRRAYKKLLQLRPGLWVYVGDGTCHDAG